MGSHEGSRSGYSRDQYEWLREVKERLARRVKNLLHPCYRGGRIPADQYKTVSKAATDRLYLRIKGKPEEAVERVHRWMTRGDAKWAVGKIGEQEIRTAVTEALRGVDLAHILEGQ